MQAHTIAHLQSLLFVSEDGRYFAFWQCDIPYGSCDAISFSVYDADRRETIIESGDDFFLFVSEVEFNQQAGYIKVMGCGHFQVLSGMAYGQCEDEGAMTWNLPEERSGGLQD